MRKEGEGGVDNDDDRKQREIRRDIAREKRVPGRVNYFVFISYSFAAFITF